MSRFTGSIIAAVLVAACLGVVAHAQQTAAPPFATTKVDGTDNVYILRNGNHQAMFVVTSAGVIATDPVAYGRPHESWAGYESGLPFVLRRYCGLWGRGT